MDDLGDGATADLADIGNFVTDGIEHRLDLLIQRLIAAHHDGQRRPTRARGSATDRCIEYIHAFLTELAMDLPNQGGRARRQVGIDIPRCRPLDDTVLPKGNGLNLSRAWQ